MDSSRRFRVMGARRAKLESCVVLHGTDQGPVFRGFSRAGTCRTRCSRPADDGNHPIVEPGAVVGRLDVGPTLQGSVPSGDPPAITQIIAVGQGKRRSTFRIAFPPFSPPSIPVPPYRVSHRVRPMLFPTAPAAGGHTFPSSLDPLRSEIYCPEKSGVMNPPRCLTLTARPYLVILVGKPES